MAEVQGRGNLCKYMYKFTRERVHVHNMHVCASICVHMHEIHVNMLLADENLRDEEVAQTLFSPELERVFLPAKLKEFLACHINRIFYVGHLRMHRGWTGQKCSRTREHALSMEL